MAKPEKPTKLVVPGPPKGKQLPLEPQFGEWISKISAGSYVVRFWILQDKGGLSVEESEALDTVREFRRANVFFNGTRKQLKESILEIFAKTSLAAFEITDRDGFGEVTYIVWP